MGCKRCGLCCAELFIEGITVDEILNRVDDPSYDFIKEHWKPLSFEEGLKRSPWVKVFKGKKVAFFECDQYDADRHVCSCHESKPSICQGFPYYGMLPDPELNIGACKYDEVESEVI